MSGDCGMMTRAQFENILDRKHFLWCKLKRDRPLYEVFFYGQKSCQRLQSDTHGMTWCMVGQQIISHKVESAKFT